MALVLPSSLSPFLVIMNAPTYLKRRFASLGPAGRHHAVLPSGCAGLFVLGMGAGRGRGWT